MKIPRGALSAAAPAASGSSQPICAKRPTADLPSQDPDLINGAGPADAHIAQTFESDAVQRRPTVSSTLQDTVAYRPKPA